MAIDRAGPTAEVAALEAKLDHATHGLAALKTRLDSILEDTGTTLEAKLDKLAGWEVKDTHAHANNIVWQEVLVITTTKRKLVKNIWLDFVNLTQNMEYRLSYKIDETNYRVFDSNAASPWTPALDDGVLIYCNFIISSDFKLELKSAVLETAVRDIPYEVDGEDME